MHAPSRPATTETVALSSADHARAKLELADLRAARNEEAADDPATLDGRINELADLLTRAEVSDDLEPRIGSTLHVEDLDSGKRASYQLGAVLDPDNRRIVSLASPVGTALASLPVGETTEVHLDGGRTRRLRLLSVDGGA